MTDDLNWWSDDPSIVQRSVMGVAVGSNRLGQIIIVEQADMCLHAEDHSITISRENALAVAKAILAEADIEILKIGYGTSHMRAPEQLESDVTSPGARRQRRYRQRHRRNGTAPDERNGGPTRDGDLLSGVTHGEAPQA